MSTLIHISELFRYSDTVQNIKMLHVHVLNICANQF